MNEQALNGLRVDCMLKAATRIKEKLGGYISDSTMQTLNNQYNHLASLANAESEDIKTDSIPTIICVDLNLSPIDITWDVCEFRFELNGDDPRSVVAFHALAPIDSFEKINKFGYLIKLIATTSKDLNDIGFAFKQDAASLNAYSAEYIVTLSVVVSNENDPDRLAQDLPGMIIDHFGESFDHWCTLPPDDLDMEIEVMDVKEVGGE